MKKHYISRTENNTILGRKSICGINSFYIDKENECKIKKNVTCKRCLRILKSKEKMGE